MFPADSAAGSPTPTTFTPGPRNRHHLICWHSDCESVCEARMAAGNLPRATTPQYQGEGSVLPSRLYAETVASMGKAKDVLDKTYPLYQAGDYDAVLVLRRRNRLGVELCYWPRCRSVCRQDCRYAACTMVSLCGASVLDSKFDPWMRPLSSRSGSVAKQQRVLQYSAALRAPGCRTHFATCQIPASRGVAAGTRPDVYSPFLGDGVSPPCRQRKGQAPHGGNAAAPRASESGGNWHHRTGRAVGCIGAQPDQDAVHWQNYRHGRCARLRGQRR